MELPDRLEWLNSLEPVAAEAELLKCCGSSEWARQMTLSRPFASLNDLASFSDEIWWSLAASDWLEAFRSHPKIGEQKAVHSVSRDSQHWSEQEQSGMQRAGKSVRDELAELNRTYEEKFGYIFIICASGKTAEQMLSALQERLLNEPEAELRCAAAEQAQITKLRLNNLTN